MLLDGSDVSSAHITGGPLNLGFLIGTEFLVKELIDGYTAFSFADPDDTSLLQVIDDSGVFVPLTV